MRQIFALSKALSKLGLKSEQYQLYSIARSTDDIYIYFTNKILEKLKSGNRERFLGEKGDDFFFGFRIVMTKDDFEEDILKKLLGFVPSNFSFELYINLANPESFPKSRWGLGFFREIDPVKKMKNGSFSHGFFEIYLIPTMEDVDTGNLKNFMAFAIEDAMPHEVTHLVNSIRQNMSESFLGMKNLDETSKEYANSKEEIQARLIPVISFIKDSIEREVESPSGGGEAFDLLSSIKNRNASRFIDIIFRLFSRELHLEDIYDENKKLIARKAGTNTINLYKKRLGDVYQEYRDKLKLA